MRHLVTFLTLALLAHAAPARAAGPQLGIADDRILLAGGAPADAAVARWSALGIGQVRILVVWSRVAPAAGALVPPAGFDAANPGDPAYDWAQIDHAVDRLAAAGIEPLLTITGPGPLWTSRDPARDDPRYEPDPAAYADFARAVALRYGDRVDRYILWNEPNLGTWLRPQASCARTCTPVAPHLYRSLVRAAYPAVHAADPGAQVLIGAMSSRGGDLRSANSTERPLVFLRALGCVSTSFGAQRTGRCAGFAPATADGFAFHPHGILNAPDKPFPNPDDVNLASLSRLESALDRLQRAGRLKPTTRHFDLYIDEYGYQTDPPDRIAGVSPATQDAWLQKAAYQAWRDPRVKLFTQYLWRDEPASGGSYSGWQSGLEYADGRAKPALKHFALPFALDASRGRLWGQVRARGPSTVEIQRRLGASGSWRTVATRRTDAQGYWTWPARLTAGASYRYLAAGAASSTLKR